MIAATRHAFRSAMRASRTLELAARQGSGAFKAELELRHFGINGLSITARAAALRSRSLPELLDSAKSMRDRATLVLHMAELVHRRQQHLEQLAAAVHSHPERSCEVVVESEVSLGSLEVPPATIIDTTPDVEEHRLARLADLQQALTSWPDERVEELIELRQFELAADLAPGYGRVYVEAAACEVDVDRKVALLARAVTVEPMNLWAWKALDEASSGACSIATKRALELEFGYNAA